MGKSGLHVNSTFAVFLQKQRIVRQWMFYNMLTPKKAFRCWRNIHFTLPAHPLKQSRLYDKCVENHVTNHALLK